MKIDETNERQLSTLAAWLEEATLKASNEAYERGKADAIKGFPEHLPAIDPESRKKLNATINEAAELIRAEAFEKGHQDGWKGGYVQAIRDAVQMVNPGSYKGNPTPTGATSLLASIEARDTRSRNDALVEIDKAWSWWIGATVDGRIRPNDTSGNTARDRAAYYLAQAAQWAWNHNNQEAGGPITRAMILQEGRKEGHAAAVDFAKQVIAGTLRDPSYGIKDAVDARVCSAETTARDEGYTSGRDDAFHSAGLMAQAALKSGCFSRFDNEGKELAEALDGFLERERDYRRRNSRDVATQECWEAFARLTEQAAAGEPFDRPADKPNVIQVPSAERRRVELALARLGAGRWPRAIQLALSYRHGDGVRIDNNDEMNFVGVLRQLRQDSYIDGFERARFRASNAAGGIQPPERHEIPDPASDVPF